LGILSDCQAMINRGTNLIKLYGYSESLTSWLQLHTAVADTLPDKGIQLRKYTFYAVASFEKG